MQILNMLAGALGRAIAYLPNVVGALIILAIGLFVAKLCEKGTRRLLASLSHRQSAQRLIENDTARERMPGTGGRIVYWVLALVTIGVAVDALHLPWLSAGVARVLGYVPRVLGAGFILVLGYLGGSFLYRQLARGEGASSLWPRIARGAVYTFAGFMALHEIGIATAIVTSAFTIVLAAMAVAGALAFGLGNRELAGRVTRDWYEQRRPRYRRYEPSTTDEPRIDPKH